MSKWQEWHDSLSPSTKEYLEGMAEQIREKIIPLLIEHDWRKQIGVILYGGII